MKSEGIMKKKEKKEKKAAKMALAENEKFFCYCLDITKKQLRDIDYDNCSFRRALHSVLYGK